jgi:hypothetical protein
MQNGEPMGEKGSNWDDIPSLDGLEVDWDYEPENPLGKRAHVRLGHSELFEMLGAEEIGVKVASSKGEQIGVLVDIAQGGVAVMLDTKLKVGTPLKIGFYLGSMKILGNCVVRSVQEIVGRYRTGMEFVALSKETEQFIAGIMSSKVFKSGI